MANRPRVLVTRRIPEAGLALLASCELRVLPGEVPPSQETLLEEVRGVDAVLALLTDRIDDAFFDAAGPQLKVVSNMAVGVDNVDLPAATRRKVPVGNTPGVLTEATADLAFALLLAAARRLPEGERVVREGRWKTWNPIGLLGRDVSGATLGIYGFGRIGQAVARRARAFGMKVLCTNRSPTADREVEQVPFAELLARSDFLSVHAPLTVQTRHAFGATAFEQMKPTAIFVNTARGGLLDQAALHDALVSGRITAAALDVTDPEPLPADHPLLKLENCLVVPHVGSATVATRDAMATLAANNVLAALRGDRLPHCVNPEVYGP